MDAAAAAAAAAGTALAPAAKRWKGVRYRRWEPSMVKPVSIVPPSEQELMEALGSKGMMLRVKPSKDKRECVFCGARGDGDTDGPGRLLCVDVDQWAHLNCALWSYDVYETMNGALMNVDAAAAKRGAATDCLVCQRRGATVGCFKQRCTNTYHLPCAKRAGVMFFQDKTLLCPVHSPKGPGPVDMELKSLVVMRKVYINRDERRQVAAVIHQEEKKYSVRIGSLIVKNIGQLLPHQIQTGNFHSKDYIYPVGFRATRLYWSFRRLNKRCKFVCKIAENESRPEFSLTVIEEGYDNETYKDFSCGGVWKKVLEPIERTRRENDLVKIFPQYINGEELYGLTEPNVLRVIESLPGIELMADYQYKYGRSSIYKPPIAINPTGCARSEPKLRTLFKSRPHTLQTSGNTRSLPQMVGYVPTGDWNLPYTKQFVHSKSQQYRRLKTEWRNNVYLRRSNIQGLGLFAARDLEKHTMVIEYIGELIRNEVAETRERQYEQQNRGVYMFRVDDSLVVDATMAGGPARYINHSCNPNCLAEVVQFERDSKIIIIAKRRIVRGEELNYDYKFEFEDDASKIPCNCGAHNCRKWMN